MKIKFTVLFLIMGAMTLFFACQKELEPKAQVEQDIEIQSGTRINYPTMEEVPEIISKLKHYTEHSEGDASRTTTGRDYFIDMNTIMEVVSEGDLTNYSFPLLVEDQSEDEFYNVIVHKDSLGTITMPYVRAYKVADYALNEYISNDKDFKYFRGTFKNYDFDSFLNTLTDNGRYQEDICNPIGYIGGGGSGGGNGNPNLIDLNNSVNWTGMDQFGYTRPMGSWNNYGGTGGYDLEVTVINGQTNTYQTASVDNLTASGISVYGGSNITSPLNINMWMTSVTITTQISGSEGGSSSSCSTTIVRWGHGESFTETRWSDCALPNQQRTAGSRSVPEGDCMPVGDDGGGVGVSPIDQMKHDIVESLDLELIQTNISGCMGPVSQS